MYCSNCGKEINENQVFCDKCGSKVGSNSNNIKEYKEQALKKLKESKIVDSLGMGNKIDENRIYIIAAILFSISGLMHFAKTVEIGMWGMAVSQNIFTMIENTFLNIIFLVLYLASAFLVIKPFINKDKIKTINVIPMIACSVSTLILFVAVMIYAYNEGSGLGAEMVLTFAGWVLILATIGTMLISIRLMLEIKRNYGREEEKSEMIKDYTPAREESDSCETEEKELALSEEFNDAGDIDEED